MTEWLKRLLIGLSADLAPIVAGIMLMVPATAAAQTPSTALGSRERVTLAVTTNVASDFGSLLLAPGLRITAPLGKYAGIDFESSAVFGGKNAPPAGSITSFLALNVRHMRAARTENGESRYWIYGLRYTPIQWPTSRAAASYDDDFALTIGHGWDQVFDDVRYAAEIGFSGGNGFLLFGTFVVGWNLHK